jgi:acyl-CoA thioester hydrolase
MSATHAREYLHTVRVPYAHTDAMGVVYYAHYYVYFEMARSEMLREAGTPYSELEKKGIGLPVVESHCEYHGSARYDDLLTIRTRCTGFRGVRLHIEYLVERNGERLATGYTEHVCIGPGGKVLKPIPELKRMIGDRQHHDGPQS